jgi:hypothetical protein
VISDSRSIVISPVWVLRTPAKKNSKVGAV